MRVRSSTSARATSAVSTSRGRAISRSTRPGAILLPPDSRQYGALDREVTLVGGGGPYFEMWDRQRFEEYERTEQHKLPDLFSAMANRGV